MPAFLHVDEAFWAGDKAGEGVLKDYVTGDTFVVEPKGVNGFPWVNRLKLLINANEDWAVPATWDERRWFMPTVSEDKKGDQRYFDELFAAIEGDELAHLLHRMLTMDLSGFNHRDPPNTEELGRQKLLGANSVAKWWHDCLLNGNASFGAQADDLYDMPDEAWPASLRKETMHAAYTRHTQRRGDRFPLSDAHFTRKLAELLPGKRLRTVRPRAAGERHYHNVLPPLEECRASFLAALRVEGYKWPTVEDESQSEERTVVPFRGPARRY